MFGFGKKKKENFNHLSFLGVQYGNIILELENEYGKTQKKVLELKLVSQYLPKNERVVEKTVVKTQSSIWHVLGMMPTNDKQKVLTAYRKMAMIYHPDHGGSSEAFQILNNAKDKALEKCK